VDITAQLGAAERDVSRSIVDGVDTVCVRLRRRYDSDLADVWQALTEPERIARWLMPVTGDLHVGGRFQLQGNAGGEILRCEPPRFLEVTFGSETSIVRVRLSPVGDGATEFELEHTVPADPAGGGGAGSLYVGPGWDGALLGLSLYLGGTPVENPAEAANSPEVQRFCKDSAYAWADVIRSSGTATEDEVAQALQVSVTHFAPDV
jgi:uncharacterized protein YndB with AHSA1/START domain